MSWSVPPFGRPRQSARWVVLHCAPIHNQGAAMFQSVEDVQQQFKNARYIASRRISTVVFLAARMGRPVLIEGPAGVGKTELAKTLAEVTARHLIRLQCYEGLDEGKALYEWKYAKQLLYTQLLRERIGELIADAPSLPDAVGRISGRDDAFFCHRFLSPRRCLHLFIDFPPADEELAIIRLKVPEVSERLAQTVVTTVQRIRGLELRKAPSISESLDWARSLVILNAEVLDRDLVESTLTMLVKHEKDLEWVKGALDKVLADLG